MLVNTALADNPEDILTALQEANQPGSMIAVQGKANAPLGDIIGQTPIPGMSPQFADMRSRCNQVIEFILGIPQYSRGVVGVADVATEVALADTATRTRNGRRIKQIEDMIRAAAERVVGLYEEYLPEDTKLPVRLTDSQEVLEVTRETLNMKDERDPGQNPLDYDYVAIPYSPTENHRLVQLQKIQQYMPLLLESPAVDKEKLIVKLLDLLQLSDVLAPAKPAQPAPAAPAAMPGMPMGAPQSDTLATGALPPGTEPSPVPTPMGGPGNPMI